MKSGDKSFPVTLSGKVTGLPDLEDKENGGNGGNGGNGEDVK
ncbi:hypothetical protein [Nostoc sp. ChiQUE02]|nr:hypothetical protein [Nostoc sp. ChiQUE02]